MNKIGELVFMLLFVFVMAVSLLASCASSYNSDVSAENVVIVGQTSDVTRYIDEEAGAVCWVYIGYQKGGISCLPINDTLLAESN